MPADKDYQFTINLPRQFSTVEKKAIAAEVVAFVRQRTIKGTDFRGNAFPKYSKEYFKKGKPDLTLSGSMLSELDAVSIKENEIVIGYADDSGNAGKAEGNQIGSYGQPDPNPKKARKFLGLKASDLKSILANYPAKDPESSAERAADVLDEQDRINKFADKVMSSDKEVDPKKLARNFKLRV